MTNAQLSLTDLPPGVSIAYLVHHRVCPTSRNANGNLRLIAAPDALLEDAVPELEASFGEVLAVESADWSAVVDALNQLDEHALRAFSRPPDDDSAADLRDLASQPPVIRFVNSLIRHGVDSGASDIHIEASVDGAFARLRIDGVLTAAPAPPPEINQAVISRIKLLADLDIAERRVPQDGRIRVRLVSRDLDLRVSTVPTMFGESVVLRILEAQGRPSGFDELGLPAAIKQSLLAVVNRPHGMMLATGPTGSGKTTTLYAALHCRNLKTEKVITVEDPIEYQLRDIAQVPVHHDTGVSFAKALRSILRQDPDAIMIGEMRDSETANLAVQAAMTGHMVFSTLHTVDSITAIPRLLDLGVPSYLVAATLDAVLAQRLVRKICTRCVAENDEWRTMANRGRGAFAGITQSWRGRGCAHCRGTGYRGRIGLFELLLPTEAMRDAISQSADRTIIRELAVASRDRCLVDDAMDRIANAQTTIEEVARVVLT